MADYTAFANLANESSASEVLNTAADYKSWVWGLLPKQRMSARTIKQAVRGAATPASWVGSDHRKEYVAYNVGPAFLEAKEIAQVTAVAEEDFEDVNIDVIELIHSLLGEAVLRGLDSTLDDATGSANPWNGTYSTVIPGATAAGNTVASTGDIAADALSASQTLAANGFRTTAYVVKGDESSVINSGTSYNTPVFTVVDGENRLWGKPVVFVDEDFFPGVEVVALDTRHFKLGVREDITFKQSDVATAIAAASGSGGTLTPADIISAFQDDCVLFRVKARFGFYHGGDATHYPAAIVTEAESI